MVAKAAKKKPAEKKQKAKKPSKAERQTLETEKVTELIRQQKVLGEATAEWNAAHAEAGAAKKEMEKQQGILNGIVSDLAAIRSGNYTPGLPFSGDQGQQVPGTETNPQVLGDDALLMPASALCEFGLTESKLETLVSAAEGNTIGAVEKFLRDNARDWQQKLKGYGETGGNMLIDALAGFRKKYPHPDPVLTTSEKEAKAAEKSEPAAV